MKKENGQNPFQMPSSQAHKGYPLKALFWPFFTGENSKVNENVHFSDFRMFCYFDPTSLGFLTPLLGSFLSPIQGSHRNDFLHLSFSGKDLHPLSKTGEGTKNGGRRYGRLPPMVWMHAHVPTPSRNVAKIAFEKGLLVLVSSTHHCASTPSLSTSWSLTAL